MPSTGKGQTRKRQSKRQTTKRRKANSPPRQCQFIGCTAEDTRERETILLAQGPYATLMTWRWEVFSCREHEEFIQSTERAVSALKAITDGSTLSCSWSCCMSGGSGDPVRKMNITLLDAVVAVGYCNYHEEEVKSRASEFEQAFLSMFKCTTE